MSSDETYLEGLIEGLTTLPNEVRRNLELMKDLDKSSGGKADELMKLQEQYLQQIQQKLARTRVVKDSRSGAVIGLQLLDDPTVVPEDAFIPTNDELFDYTYDPNLYARIQKSQQECLQKAEEKVAVAQQTYELIDANVRRLDRDLEAMEELLQASGEFNSGATARPDDLAACQVSPGSEWILAKVLDHDPNTGMYQLADEDVESNKIFNLPAQQVKVLHSTEKLRSGDTVYAVYPDTTSFYQATVVQAPRRQGATGASFVMVQFQDDADEFGITHTKPIPLKHVMPPP
ncbi:hypothetical protein ACA910_017796 [Epithemia clementina (nom. ined.)]